MRRLLFVGLSVLGLGLATQPALQAQGSLDLNSSMSALCVGGSCQNVQFTLDVAGDVFVDIVRLFSGDASLWKFGSLVKVVDSHGTDVTASFTGAVDAAGLVLTANSPAALLSEPLSLLVNMDSWSSSNDLGMGVLTYTANGELAEPFDGKDLWSTSGTVTPEPSTFVLLATGLIGLFGVVRKRKGSMIEREDAAAC